MGNTPFIAAKLARVSVERSSLALLPLIAINLVMLLRFTHYPPFRLWLPRVIRP